GATCWSSSSSVSSRCLDRSATACSIPVRAHGFIYLCLLWCAYLFIWPFSLLRRSCPHSIGRRSDISCVNDCWNLIVRASCRYHGTHYDCSTDRNYRDRHCQRV